MAGQQTHRWLILGSLFARTFQPEGRELRLDSASVLPQALNRTHTQQQKQQQKKKKDYEATGARSDGRRYGRTTTSRHRGEPPQSGPSRQCRQSRQFRRPAQVCQSAQSRQSRQPRHTKSFGHDSRHSAASCLLFILFLACLVVEPILEDSAQAASVQALERLYEHLFTRPCQKFGIPKEVALAIARQESDGHPFVINVEGKDFYPKTRQEAEAMANRLLRQGRSFDVGLMQINVLWMRKYRIPPAMLLDIRNNIYMGCFILSRCMKEAGRTWKAVGLYHSHTPSRRDRYIRSIRKHYLAIAQERTQSP